MKLFSCASPAAPAPLFALLMGDLPASALVEPAPTARHLQKQVRRHESPAVGSGERLEPLDDGGEPETAGGAQEPSPERREDRPPPRCGRRRGRRHGQGCVRGPTRPAWAGGDRVGSPRGGGPTPPVRAPSQ